MDKILWDLFKTTGDIKYFLLLQKLGGQDGKQENQRNSAK